MTSRIKEGLRIKGLEFDRISTEITYAQLAAITPAATTVTVSISGFPTKAIPMGARIRKKALLIGTSITAVTAEVGDAGDTDELLGATDVHGGSVSTDYESPPAPQALLGTEEAAYAPIVTVELTGANNSALTAGSVVVDIYYQKFNPNA